MAKFKETERFNIYVARENRMVDDESIESRYLFHVVDGVEDTHNLYGFCLNVVSSLINDKLALTNVPPPIKDVKNLLEEQNVDVEGMTAVLNYLNHLIQQDKDEMNSLSKI